MATEVKLKTTDLKISTEYDSEAQSVVASIKFKAKISGSDILTLYTLQGYPTVDCVLGTDQLRMKMEVDPEKGEED